MGLKASEAFFAWCHFLPGIRGLVISLPITLARPRPNLARDVPLHPSSPQHPPPPPSPRPRPDFSCLWLCHSQHMPASVENTIAIFFARGEDLCFSVTSREKPRAYLWQMTLYCGQKQITQPSFLKTRSLCLPLRDMLCLLRMCERL